MAQPVLEGVQKAFGFIPNLMATMANSPEMLKGYLALDAEWDKTSFTPQERNLALLAASLENQCGYCTAAPPGRCATADDRNWANKGPGDDRLRGAHQDGKGGSQGNLLLQRHESDIHERQG